MLQSESTVVFQQRRLGGMDLRMDEWIVYLPLGHKNFGPNLPLLFKMDEIGHSFHENYENCCHLQMSDFKAKCTNFDFGWGSVPDPAGELTALPRTPKLDCMGLLLRGGEGQES